MYIGEKLTPG